jgi:hypothetical protein
MASQEIPPLLIISDVSVTNVHKSYITESMSGKFQSRDSGVQRFKGTVKLTAPDTFRGGQTLNGFLAKLRGRLNTFELRLGGTYASDDINTGQVLVNGPHSIGSTTVSIDGYNGNVNSGQVFNAPNDDKMYICLSDVTNFGTMEIIPALSVSLNNNDILNFLTPSFTVILDSNETTIEHSESGLVTSATLNWTEKI